TRAQDKANPALAPVRDDPRLPRVLLIGDSISVGYTVPTRELLAGKANVDRIPENGGSTGRGLEKIDAWLGAGPWDVIHFNWGLHDIRRVEGNQPAALAAYEKRLRALIKKLQATRATLIWASTTPVPEARGTPC